MDKAQYLRNNGWKEVDSDTPGQTCWQAPTRLTQAPLYFTLDAAYALETEGEGIWAYAGQIALEEDRRAEDIRRMDEAEEKYFRETGQRHGVWPNY